MNLYQVGERLKDFSKEQLIKEMQQPSGSAPMFLVMSELQRRTRMEREAAQAQKPSGSTVAEDAVAAAGVPQGGLAALSRAMAPKTDMVQNTGAAPAQPVARMAEGGKVDSDERPIPVVYDGAQYSVYDDGRVEDARGRDVRESNPLLAQLLRRMSVPGAISRARDEMFRAQTPGSEGAIEVPLESPQVSPDTPQLVRVQPPGEAMVPPDTPLPVVGPRGPYARDPRRAASLPTETPSPVAATVAPPVLPSVPPAVAPTPAVPVAPTMPAPGTMVRPGELQYATPVPEGIMAMTPTRPEPLPPMQGPPALRSMMPAAMAPETYMVPNTGGYMRAILARRGPPPELRPLGFPPVPDRPPHPALAPPAVPDVPIMPDPGAVVRPGELQYATPVPEGMAVNVPRGPQAKLPSWIAEQLASATALPPDGSASQLPALRSMMPGSSPADVSDLAAAIEGVESRARLDRTDDARASRSRVTDTPEMLYGPPRRPDVGTAVREAEDAEGVVSSGGRSRRDSRSGPTRPLTLDDFFDRSTSSGGRRPDGGGGRGMPPMQGPQLPERPSDTDDTSKKAPTDTDTEQPLDDMRGPATRTPGGGAGGVGGVAPASGTTESSADDTDKWMALARFGLALMGSNAPTLGGAISEAGLPALDYLEAAKDRRYERDMEERKFQLAQQAAAMRGRGGSPGPSLRDIVAYRASVADELTVARTPAERTRLSEMLEQLDGMLAGVFGMVPDPNVTQTQN